MAGDTNSNLAAPKGDRRGEDIAADLATEGLEDMSAHFLLRRRPWFRDGRTWSILHKGREVRSRTDYTLGTDIRLFGNISVRDPRHNSDHYLVLGCLHSASLKEHMWYLGGWKKIPLQLPTEPTREDEILADLRRAVPKAQAREARRNEWISAATWRLVDERVSARRYPEKGRTIIRRLGRAIKASLTTDRRRQAEEAGSEVEALVGADPPLIQEAWKWIKGWYKAAVDCAPPPARVTLDRITVERVTLYIYVTPPGENIPISVKPFPVDDSVPEEDDIE